MKKRVLGLLSLVWMCAPVGGEEVIDAGLREDFESALAKLPPTLRERVDDVVLKRAEDLGIGGEWPLGERLLNRAAYASFGILERELTVYDAGAANLPTWKGDGPSKEEVAVLLAGVADVLGVAAPAEGDGEVFSEAWREFVRRIYAWGKDEVPAVTPAVDDPDVWNRFLRDGVWRLMGEEVPMEQLLLHELGHALQLESRSMIPRMAFWAELSGWLERERSEAADGFVGGMNKMEKVLVLMRHLLAGDPAKISRGETADLEASAAARFVNRYARYDLREDYAESFRLMAYDPARLAKEAPEKFLYLNALGWNARLDSEKPGPLWYSGAEFERLLPKGKRRELFARILGKEGRGPALDPVPLAAVLRAHAGELTEDDLPEPYPVMGMPDDLPGELRKKLDRNFLTVEIDGVVHVASPERQKLQQDRLLGDWTDHYSFELMMLKFLGKGTKGLRSAYEENVAGEEDPVRRANLYEALREYGEKAFSNEEWSAWNRAEATAQHQAGNVWMAARYSILASEKTTEELFEEIKDLAEKGEGGFERIRFLGTAVDLALATEDPEVVKTKIAGIPGETLGKWLRVKYLLRAAQAFEGEIGEAFEKAARSEAEGCRFPRLKQELESLQASE